MSDPTMWDLSRTALLTIDLQNDFLHPDGAYGRAGQGAASIAALPARIAPWCAVRVFEHAAPERHVEVIGDSDHRPQLGIEDHGPVPAGAAKRAADQLCEREHDDRPAEHAMGGRKQAGAALSRREHEGQRDQRQYAAADLQHEMAHPPELVVELGRPVLPTRDLEVARDDDAYRNHDPPAERHESRVPLVREADVVLARPTDRLQQEVEDRIHGKG